MLHTDIAENAISVFWSAMRTSNVKVAYSVELLYTDS